jgi:hypothetical protein
MKLTLRQQITQFAHVLQSQLFPALEESVGELDETARRLVAVLELVPLARFVPASGGWTGRPRKDRLAIASAFVAKAVYGFSLTRQLLERLHQDPQLRRICGWQHAHQVPHESTFSRAFAEFAAMELPQFVHEALIVSTQKDRLSVISLAIRQQSKRANAFRKLPPKPRRINRLPPAPPPHAGEEKAAARTAATKAASAPRPRPSKTRACTASAA